MYGVQTQDSILVSVNKSTVHFALILIMLCLSTAMAGCDKQDASSTQGESLQPATAGSGSTKSDTNKIVTDADAADKTNAAGADQEDNETLADNIKSDVINKQSADENAPLSADAGKVLYEQKCKVCHEPGLLNSPKFGDVAAWTPRIAKGKETLYKHSAEGFNQMPAQAVNGVSEAQVHAAVDYMIEKSS